MINIYKSLLNCSLLAVTLLLSGEAFSQGAQQNPPPQSCGQPPNPPCLGQAMGPNNPPPPNSPMNPQSMGNAGSASSPTQNLIRNLTSMQNPNSMPGQQQNVPGGSLGGMGGPGGMGGAGNGMSAGGPGPGGNMGGPGGAMGGGPAGPMAMGAPEGPGQQPPQSQQPQQSQSANNSQSTGQTSSPSQPQTTSTAFKSNFLTVSPSQMSRTASGQGANAGPSTKSSFLTRTPF